MNLKSQVIAINKLLSDIYQIQDMRLSYLLAELAFTDADIRLISQKLLPNVAGIFLNVLENKVKNFPNGVRKFKIIEDLYGLNGDSSKKLREVGAELNLSHERVRQIKNRVIKRLAYKNNQLWKSEFKSEVMQLLEDYNNCARLDNQYFEIESHFYFKSSLSSTGEKTLTISEGNNEIVITEADFPEFYDNLLHNIKLLSWHEPQASKIKVIRKKYSRAYEIWTSEEEQWLKNYLAEDLSISEIAELLERQPGAISSRINKLGLR